jgi:hypothetical protein
MPRGDGDTPGQPEPQLHPLMVEFAQEWQSAQIGQKHAAEAISKILEAWQADRSEIASLRAQLAAARGEFESTRNAATGEAVAEPAEPMAADSAAVEPAVLAP